MLVRLKFASVASLLGDPTRARMVEALMDGRALTATELALDGGVTASTASSHLSRLRQAGLITVARQGRHRYFRIASAEVAKAVEGLMGLAGGGDAVGARGIQSAEGTRARVRTGPRDAGLREARVCYDHLAGLAGVQLLDTLKSARVIVPGDEGLRLTRRGREWCSDFCLDLLALRASRRPLCRACLDWSERREHLAGALGAAILDRLLELRYARREPVGRAVALSELGRRIVEGA